MFSNQLLDKQTGVSTQWRTFGRRWNELPLRAGARGALRCVLLSDRSQTQTAVQYTLLFMWFFWKRHLIRFRFVVFFIYMQ